MRGMARLEAGFLRTLTSMPWHRPNDDFAAFEATEQDPRMNFRNVTVAGTGVLGSQIAYQTAYKGLLVRVYDISDDVLVHARERFIKLKENYREDLDLTQQTV